MNITRRSALGGVLSFGAAGSSTAAVSIIEPEHPVTRLHRLAEEVSAHMPHWDAHMGGSWELRARSPEADGTAHLAYVNLRENRTPRERMTAAMREYKRAAMEIEPSCTKWFEQNWSAEDNAARFGFFGYAQEARS